MPPVLWENAWANASYKSVWHMNVKDGATIDSVYAYAADVLNPNEYCGAGVAGTVAMGHRGDNQPACVWTGDLDEFRFRSVSSSDEWVAAEYASQANPALLRN